MSLTVAVLILAAAERSGTRSSVRRSRFGQTFKVFCGDDAFANRVLTQHTTRFLLKSAGGGFDICDGQIVVVRDGVLTATNVDLHLDYLAALIELLPTAQTPFTASHP